MLSQSMFYDGNYFTMAAFSVTLPLSLLYTSVSNLIFSLRKRVSNDPLDLLKREECFQIPQNATGNSLPLAIVTGSNTGIGFELSYRLASRGYNVILACRSRDRGEAAAKNINLRVKLNHACSLTGMAIFIHPCDLSSLESVQGFVEAFTKCSLYSGSLNVLVNNAGINTNGVSADGLDLCFQSNFVGHYMLTRLLLPDLKRAKNYVTPTKFEAGRIVNLSSVMHHFASSLPHTEKEWMSRCIEFTPGDQKSTYSHSKVAALLLTVEMNKRYGRDGVRAISVNPGAVNSDIWRGINPTLFKYIVGPIFRLIYLTTEQGSCTSLAAAIGNVPKDAIYLQPYWLPELPSSTAQIGKSYKCPFPLFETLGPYVGYAVTSPRLPEKDGGMQSAMALWDACETTVLRKLTNLNFP